jgi:hypothetical protein
MAAPVLGLDQFGVNLCKALGLNPDVTRHICMDCPCDGIVTVYVEQHITEEMSQEVVAAVKAANQENWRKYLPKEGPDSAAKLTRILDGRIAEFSDHTYADIPAGFVAQRRVGVLSEYHPPRWRICREEHVYKEGYGILIPQGTCRDYFDIAMRYITLAKDLPEEKMVQVGERLYSKRVLAEAAGLPPVEIEHPRWCEDIEEWTLTPDKWLKGELHFEEKPPLGALLGIKSVGAMLSPDVVTATIKEADGRAICWASGTLAMPGGCYPIAEPIELTNPPQRVSLKGRAGRVIVLAKHEGQWWTAYLEKRALEEAEATLGVPPETPAPSEGDAAMEFFRKTNH